MEIGIFGLIHLILWIVAMVSILTSSGSIGYKVLWSLIVFFLPCLGLILYYVIGRKAVS